MSSKRQRERDDKKFLPKKPWPAQEQPNKTVKVLRYQRLGAEVIDGWEVRTVLVDCISYMGKPYKDHRNRPGRFMLMRQAYTPEGKYLGNPRDARRLFRHGIRRCELADKDHGTCSIGFDPEKRIWYGWSHRAICGFRVGDRVYNERWRKQRADGKTPFRKHGDRAIKTMADAKLAARRFARSVS